MDAFLANNAVTALATPFNNMNNATMGRLAPLNAMASGKSVDATASDFEAMFMSQMLQPMFSTIDVNDTFGGGHAEEIMRSMMVQEYGKAIAAHSTSGLGAAIRNEMIKKQGRNKLAKNSFQVDEES